MGYRIDNSGTAAPVGCGGALLSTGALLFVGAMVLASFAFVFWERNAPFSERAECYVASSVVTSLADSWRPVWNVTFRDRRGMISQAYINGSDFTKGYRCSEDYCIPPREKAERVLRTREVGEFYECYYDPYRTWLARWDLQPATEFAVAMSFGLAVSGSLILAGAIMMRRASQLQNCCGSNTFELESMAPPLAATQGP